MTAAVLRGRVLTPLASGGVRWLDDGLVAIDGAGRIADVRPWEARDAEGPHTDLRPAVILPGLVDAHLHFPQTRIIGSASGPLLAWLERSVFPEEARFREVDYARAVAREFARRMIAAGTTTCAAFSSSSAAATDALFEELARSGLRGHAGLTLMDQSCPDALRVPLEEAIPAARDLIAKWHGHDGRLGFAVTPRFALSCSRPLLEAAARLAADHDLLVQTHVSENLAEGVATLEVHPWADDYLGVYEAVGLVGRRTILAHAIYLSEPEWDRLAERGGAVAHCPDSNFFLGSGRMNLDAPRRRGIPVGLGSDVAAGRSFSIRRAMAHAYDNALCAGACATPEELFTMATLGGARALGLGDVVGSLEAGKEADLVVVPLADHAASRDAVLAHVAFHGDDLRPDRVMVRGRWLM